MTNNHVCDELAQCTDLDIRLMRQTMETWLIKAANQTINAYRWHEYHWLKTHADCRSIPSKLKLMHAVPDWPEGQLTILIKRTGWALNVESAEYCLEFDTIIFVS